jgi:hypothetical protein
MFERTRVLYCGPRYCKRLSIVMYDQSVGANTYSPCINFQLQRQCGNTYFCCPLWFYYEQEGYAKNTCHSIHQQLCEVPRLRWKLRNHHFSVREAGKDDEGYTASCVITTFLQKQSAFHHTRQVVMISPIQLTWDGEVCWNNFLNLGNKSEGLCADLAHLDDNDEPSPM